MGGSVNESDWHTSFLKENKKKHTYKIISHQKLCFVIFCCDAVFHQQGLYVFVHVHPLHCLFYLFLGLEYINYNINLRNNCILMSRMEFRAALRVGGFAQSWTCGGCIYSICWRELQSAVFPAPVWSEKAENNIVTLLVQHIQSLLSLVLVIYSV